jgi:hypothetical protein
MNIGTRNNNWMNIRYSSANNWKGQSGREKGFCIFDTVEHGLRAGRKILTHYIDNGFNTPEKMINRFAPPNENDTEAYITNICRWSGLLRDETITHTYGLQQMIRAMCQMETGNVPTNDMLRAMWED